MPNRNHPTREDQRPDSGCRRRWTRQNCTSAVDVSGGSLSFNRVDGASCSVVQDMPVRADFVITAHFEGVMTNTPAADTTAFMRLSIDTIHSLTSEVGDHAMRLQTLVVGGSKSKVGYTTNSSGLLRIS